MREHEKIATCKCWNELQTRYDELGNYLKKLESEVEIIKAKREEIVTCQALIETHWI